MKMIHFYISNHVFYFKNSDEHQTSIKQIKLNYSHINYFSLFLCKITEKLKTS